MDGPQTLTVRARNGNCNSWPNYIMSYLISDMSSLVFQFHSLPGQSLPQPKIPSLRAFELSIYFCPLSFPSQSFEHNVPGDLDSHVCYFNTITTQVSALKCHHWTNDTTAIKETKQCLLSGVVQTSSENRGCL